MKPCRFNHNPTLLKTISGSSSHTINKPQYPSICSSCSPSFRPHLLVSSPSLSWLSRTCPSRVSYSLNEVTFSEASFPSFAEIFVCLENPCQTFQNSDINWDSSQSPLSPRSFFWCFQFVPHFPSPELWQHALYLIIFLF